MIIFEVNFHLREFDKLIYAFIEFKSIIIETWMIINLGKNKKSFKNIKFKLLKKHK
jgi:hypothetical protein